MRHLVNSTSDLGRIVRDERKRQGIRQDDLAGMADASDLFLRQLEHGKPTAQIGKVLRVLEELGIRVILEHPDDGPAPAERT